MQHIFSRIQAYTFASEGSRPRGGVLVGAVVAIVIMGALGAGMVSMLGSSSMHEVRANHGERAYYMAESGFRYAVSVYKQHGKNAFLDLDSEPPINVPGGGRFALDIQETTTPDYTESFTVSYLDGDGEKEPNASVPKRSDLRVDLPEGGKLPAFGGLITVAGLNVRYREFRDSMLRHITYDGADGALSLQIDTPATLTPIARVDARGTYPDSAWNPLRVERTVTYWWPMSGSGLGFDDGVEIGGVDSSDMQYWAEGVGSKGSGNVLGDYEAVNVDGSLALKLDGMSPGAANPMTGLLFQGGSVTSPGYEVQVKVKLDETLGDPHYVAGILFRQQGSALNLGQLRSYGISFVQGATAEKEKDNLVPSQLLPLQNTPMIVLWRLDGNPNTNNPVTRLAYAPISTSNIVDNTGKIRDWSTLLVRVEQIGDPGSEYNRIMVAYGDHDRSGTANANPFDQPRLSNTRNGVTINEQTGRLPWPPNDINSWSADRDYFTVVEWNSSVGGGASRHYEDVSNTARYFLIHTAEEENLFNAETLEVGLHTWGKNMEGKVYFDDFAVRQAPPGGGGGFVRPIQQ